MTLEQILLALGALNAAGVGTMILSGLRWMHRVELRLMRIETELHLSHPGDLGR